MSLTPEESLLKDVIKDPSRLEGLTNKQLQELVDQLQLLTGKNQRDIPGSPGLLAVELTKDSQTPWVFAPHLKILDEWLVDLAEGRRKRILVSMPPRHGKSELISFWFPLWFLAKFPQKRVMLASYEHDFAAEWGRKVRDSVIEWGDKLGISVNPDKLAAHAWQLQGSHHISMQTAGVGGPLTGKGADALIIDDPIKNNVDAASETIRERNWNWFQTAAHSRLEPGGFIIVVATRWHEDDLIGRLERASQDDSGAAYDILKFPALAEKNDPLGREEGDPLWPARYPKLELESIRKIYTPYNWSALYQQRPTPEEGGGVKRKWWKFYHAQYPPSCEAMLQSWDLAFKDLQDSDYCVGQVWGRSGASVYLLDQARGRMNLPEVSSAIRNMTQRYPKALRKLIEDKANGPALIQTLQHEVMGMIPVKVKESKDARLAAVTPMIEAGNVFLPGKKNALDEWEPAYPWVAHFIEECAAFPNGTNDDMVDAMVHALRFFQPQTWNLIGPAWKEAAKGPPPKTIEEYEARKRRSQFAAKMKRAEKKFNKSAAPFASSFRRRIW